jgi:hypothetical protein
VLEDEQPGDDAQDGEKLRPEAAERFEVTFQDD